MEFTFTLWKSFLWLYSISHISLQQIYAHNLKPKGFNFLYLKSKCFSLFFPFWLSCKFSWSNNINISQIFIIIKCQKYKCKLSILMKDLFSSYFLVFWWMLLTARIRQISTSNMFFSLFICAVKSVWLRVRNHVHIQQWVRMERSLSWCHSVL